MHAEVASRVRLVEEMEENKGDGLAQLNVLTAHTCSHTHTSVQSWQRRPAQAHSKLSGSSWSSVAMETSTEAKHDGTTSGATKMAYKTQAG